MIKPGIFLHSSKKGILYKNAFIYSSFAASQLDEINQCRILLVLFFYDFHSYLGFIRVCQNRSAVCMIPIMLTTSLFEVFSRKSLSGAKLELHITKVALFCLALPDTH